MATIDKYIKNKQRFGDYWGLYMIGITSIDSIKYTLARFIISTLFGILITYNMNKILMDTTLCSIVVYSTCMITHPFIEYTFEKYTTQEIFKIIDKIGNYVNKLYREAPYTWKQQYTNTERTSSIEYIISSYNQTATSILYMIRDGMHTLSIIILSVQKNILITFVIAIGTAVLLKLKTYYAKELSEIDKKMTAKMHEIRLATSNQFTNQNDIEYTPTISELLHPSKYNPIDGSNEASRIWDNRNLLSTRKTSINTSLQESIIMLLVTYLYHTENKECVVFVINSYCLFGLMNLISNFEQRKDLYMSKLTSTFDMLDKLHTHRHHNNKSNPPSTLKTIKKIQIYNITRPISPKLSLAYDGRITINMEPGIILLNGQKGCGKSVTMDILAGLYDDSITQGLFINDIKMPNEFRDLKPFRSYVRQCVVDDYKANKTKTVSMTPSELFPHHSSYTEIMEFVGHFAMAHKMPKNINDRISQNEKGLSPGETQALILASQLWKALKLKSQLLLLDEPERNIDFETVKKIFTWILATFQVPIILITHSNELKQLVRPQIKQTWTYASNDPTILTFTTQDTETDQKQFFL